MRYILICAYVLWVAGTTSWMAVESTETQALCEKVSKAMLPVQSLCLPAGTPPVVQY